MAPMASTREVGPLAVRADAIAWEPANSDGTRSALLQGNREGRGTFTYAFFIPAGVWDAPHSHGVDARIVVATGELRLAYGRALEKARAESFGVGSFLFVPAGAVHYDGAEVDTIIIGTASGPWSTDYVDAPSAAADGRH